MSKEKSRKINIEIDEKTSEGIYSNLAIINHSASEFVMDFISIMPGSSKNKVKSRIIITPQHAKKLRKALNDNIDRFEQNFGSIKDYENPKFQLNFGPTAKA
jgi:predicted transcriptional regulator